MKRSFALPTKGPPPGGVRINHCEPRKILIAGSAHQDLENRHAASYAQALPYGSMPWVAVPEGSKLRKTLESVLPAPRAPMDFYSVPKQPTKVVELDGCISNLDDLKVVLETLRAQTPFIVTTLSLRHCPALRSPECVALLASFLAEAPRLNPPPLTSANKKPTEAIIEVLYLNGSVDDPRRISVVDAAWRKYGWLHGPTPEMPLPITFRRKSSSYAQPERLKSMPSWAATKIDAKPKGKRGKKKKGKKGRNRK